MNPLAKRRAQLTPEEQHRAEEEARRRVAMAVSLAERKAKAETQAEVLEALAQIKTGN